jgi:hypothetical protein
VRGSKVAAIDGVLWLDRATGAPRSVEYEYRDPSGVVPRGAKGLVAFGAGKDGLPQLIRWWVRVPQVFESSGTGRITSVVESGAFAFDASDRPLEDPDGVFAALGEVFSIDPILVEGERAQRRTSDEGSRYIEPRELIGAPPTHGWDIVRSLRPNWIQRGEAIALSEASSAGGLSLVVYLDRMRISCLMADKSKWVPGSQHPLGMSQGAVPGAGGEQCMPPEIALRSVAAPDIASIEYVPPVEAGAIYGMGHGYGVVVIHSRRQ